MVLIGFNIFMRKSSMRKPAIIYSAIVIVSVLLISCSGPQKSPEEENVLTSLNTIQNSLEADISYDKYAELLVTTKMKLDQLKQSEQNNSCFKSAVEKCYASYEIARKAWRQRLATDDEKRKQDMDMTFSFSISFASLSIEKANNCYK